jgi:hypothetical protein
MSLVTNDIILKKNIIKLYMAELLTLPLSNLIRPSQVSGYNREYCWTEDNGLGRYLGKFRNITIDEKNPDNTLYHFDYHTIKKNIIIDGVDYKSPLKLRRILNEACIPSPEEFEQMTLEEIKQFVPDTTKIPLRIYVERIGPIHNEIKQQIKKAENRPSAMPLSVSVANPAVSEEDYLQPETSVSYLDVPEGKRFGGTRKKQKKSKRKRKSRRLH